MTEHEWKKETNGAKACTRCGVRTFVHGDGVVTWQRKKGGHWRRVERQHMPECKEAKP